MNIDPARTHEKKKTAKFLFLICRDVNHPFFHWAGNLKIAMCRSIVIERFARRSGNDPIIPRGYLSSSLFADLSFMETGDAGERKAWVRQRKRE